MKDNKFWNYGYSIGIEKGKITQLDRLIQDPYFLSKKVDHIVEEISKILLTNDISLLDGWLDDIQLKDIYMFIGGYNEGKSSKQERR